MTIGTFLKLALFVVLALPMVPAHTASGHDGHYMGAMGARTSGGCPVQGMGHGMMGHGMMGHGTMGHGMGHDMMRHGMMGQDRSHGMMGQGMNPGMAAQREQDLKPDDVTDIFQHRLEHYGNERLRVGKVELSGGNPDIIVAEIETVDGSLVERFQVDRHTGSMHPVRKLPADKGGQAPAATAGAHDDTGQPEHKH